MISSLTKPNIPSNGRGTKNNNTRDDRYSPLLNRCAITKTLSYATRPPPAFLTFRPFSYVAFFLACFFGRVPGMTIRCVYDSGNLLRSRLFCDQAFICEYKGRTYTRRRGLAEV